MICNVQISDGATVSLVSKQINPNASLATPLDEDTELLAPSPLPSPKRGPPMTNTNVESDLEEGFQFYHLSPLFEDDAFKKNKKGLRNSSNTGPRIKHRKIREIYLRRLVSTKKSIQTFVDDVLAVMLRVSDDRPFPKALKYLFDFFDRQADRHKLKGAADMWKNSCLPLRFWVTAMTHPAYVFDMHQTDTIDASVSVLTQMLDNACKGIVPKYSIETSPSRVLYANELPNYIEMIQTFYNDIRTSSRVNQDVLDMEFKEVCEIFQNSFSHIGTLHQLYQHASQRSDKLVEALEEDEQCQRANMGYKLEQVGTILAEGED
ncbi:plexin-A1-like [Diadema antillarum]|uniref:plexin-A1-like n=1 Tax=Diadema antillarum TaxID=105358 RepID=UPI003A8767AA